MKTKLIFFATIFYLQFIICTIISAQSILISPSTGVPDPSAGLEVRSSNKGMLLPRVALTGTADVSTITNPANGLMVFNTATVSDVVLGFYYWTSGTAKWNPVNGSGTAASNIEYWDGANWVVVPAGTEGQYLMVSASNIPTWLSIVVPTLSTLDPSIVTSSSATSGGNITSDGGSAILARGICWKTSTCPTTADSKTTDGSGIGAFGSFMTGLGEGSTYYVRAYATNTVGTAYGNEINFTAANLPALSTTEAYSVTTSTAESGGDISSNGGSAVIEHGVCWAIYPAIPTTADNKTTEGAVGTGSFTSSITGLTRGRL